MTGSDLPPHATLLDGLAAPDLDFDLDLPSAWAALRTAFRGAPRTGSRGPSR